jgi:putative membrane protein
MLTNLVQGLFIGVALVLPGLSAGTVILILGFYIRFLEDLASLRLKQYLPLFAGAFAGVLIAVYTISYLLERYNSIIMALIVGMLLASIPSVINYSRGSGLKPVPLLFAAAGFVVTWYLVCDPSQTFTVLPPGGHFHFFIGGVLASATMLLPGVSGSAVLVIMNLYDDVIIAVSTWQWVNLAFLAAGFVVGLFALARLLSALYRRYQTEISFLLAGLILGSTRALLPASISLQFIIAAAAGAALVLYLTRKRINL